MDEGYLADIGIREGRRDPEKAGMPDTGKKATGLVEQPPVGETGDEAEGEGGANASALDDLRLEIDHAITLIIAKEYVKLLTSLPHPEDQAEIAKRMTLAEWAAGFGKTKALDLRSVLEAARETTPTVEAKGERAVFRVPEATRPLIFEQVEGRWRLRN